VQQQVHHQRRREGQRQPQVDIAPLVPVQRPEHFGSLWAGIHGPTEQDPDENDAGH
jgi:hypothetical protein